MGKRNGMHVYLTTLGGGGLIDNPSSYWLFWNPQEARLSLSECPWNAESYYW